MEEHTFRDFRILQDWWREVTPQGKGRICCFPDPPGTLDRLLEGDNRLLWMLIAGLPWSPADHRYFPPAFKAAVRTLLLVHHRGTSGATPSGGTGAPTGLYGLFGPAPPEVVKAVIREAAFPLRPWLAPDPHSSDWLTTEFDRQPFGLPGEEEEDAQQETQQEAQEQPEAQQDLEEERAQEQD